mgnify:CR=1 FL=1
MCSSDLIHRLQTNGQGSEKTFNSSFLNDITTTTTAAMEFTVFGSDVKDNETLFVLCLQVLLVGKPESMVKQTCTHWKSDFLTKCKHRYALLR